MPVDQKEAWSRFIQSLPTETVISCYRVEFRRREDGQVGIKVDPQAVTEVGDANSGQQTSSSVGEILAFLAFFLKTIAGPQVLTLEDDDVNKENRLQLLKMSFDAWRSMNGPRGKDGRLKKSMQCIGYAPSQEYYAIACRCCNRTKNPRGTCHIHDNAGSPTLWNRDPLTEKVREREETVRRVKEYLETQEALQKPVTPAQRRVLESIHVSVARDDAQELAQLMIDRYIEVGKLPPDVLEPPTQDQLPRLRELGVADWEGLTKRSASQLISRAKTMERWARPSGPVLSQAQYDFIERLGGIAYPTLTRKQASQFIEYLLEREAHCPNCRANDDRRHERCPYCGGFLSRSSPIEPPASLLGLPTALPSAATHAREGLLAAIRRFLGL